MTALEHPEVYNGSRPFPIREFFLQPHCGRRYRTPDGSIVAAQNPEEIRGWDGGSDSPTRFGWFLYREPAEMCRFIENDLVYAAVDRRGTFEVIPITPVSP